MYDRLLSINNMNHIIFRTFFSGRFFNLQCLNYVRVVPYNGIFIGRKSIGEELKILLRLIQRYLPNENRVDQPY